LLEGDEVFRLFNSLSLQKEVFEPLEPEGVRLYTCGPTVYDYAHIGNFRTFVFDDLLRRYLAYKGYRVTQVMNITDVDDKTIRGSQEEGISLEEHTARYTEAFFEDFHTLNIERAEHYPAATEHIAEMVELVKRLTARGYTYEVGGSTYFRIAAFPEYGKLSHIVVDRDASTFSRVEADEYGKEAARDFALWKAWSDADGEVAWDTEIGRGRPGWHIECSAMSMKYLGEQFDIHTGGIDNMFPHHENEIAQSEAATGEPFVKYWLHCQHLLVDNKKMSKSLGNYYTLRDLLAEGYKPKAIRYELLSTHYRQQHNFTLEGLKASGQSVQRLLDFMANLRRCDADESTIGDLLAMTEVSFERSLDDDLNISAALAAVFDFVREANRLMAAGKFGPGNARHATAMMQRFDTALGLLEEEPLEADDELQRLIEEREEARRTKNYARADEIRAELRSRGCVVEDTPEGPRLKQA